MYSPTFWQDHVTEFDNRFREQNNSDGTITHIPIEGEVIQEGTPQNAANFNNIEMGIFAANEIAAELARIALNRASGIIGTGGGGTDSGNGESVNATRVIYQQIEIPAVGWEVSESGYCVDIPVEGVTADMIPIITIPKTATQETGNFAWNYAETVDGFVRLCADSAPENTFVAYATLIMPFAVNDGATVFKVASAADVKGVVNGIFG